MASRLHIHGPVNSGHTPWKEHLGEEGIRQLAASSWQWRWQIQLPALQIVWGSGKKLGLHNPAPVNTCGCSSPTSTAKIVMVIRAGREFPSTWVAFHSCQNSPHPTPSSQGSVSLVQQDRSLPRGISSERDPGTLARVPAPSLVRSCAAASAGMGRWKLAGSCPGSHPNFSGWCLATPAKPWLLHPTAFCVGVAVWVTKGWVTEGWVRVSGAHGCPPQC